MTNNLEGIAQSANAAFASSPGFVGCAVRSHHPPILEFRLATHSDAERFKIHLELHNSGLGFRHEIDPRNPAVLLQYR
jgi:hypothetical protein